MVFHKFICVFIKIIIFHFFFTIVKLGCPVLSYFFKCCTLYIFSLKVDKSLFIQAFKKFSTLVVFTAFSCQVAASEQLTNSSKPIEHTFIESTTDQLKFSRLSTIDGLSNSDLIQ